MMRRLSLCAVMVALVAPGLAAAQAPRPAPAPPVQSLVQGQDMDQPVQIQAASLEVRDKHNMATFSGGVQMVQGDTTMKCQKLVVYYGQEDGIAPAAAPAPTGPKGAQNIRRIEARGGVTIITKDQYASGDLGVYDLIANTITLTGNVVVSHGKGKTQ
jgi:lipopolysaccharide export system protein LptA